MKKLVKQFYNSLAGIKAAKKKKERKERKITGRLI